MPKILPLSNRPLPIIFAHRGASGHKHENTFEAFDTAIAMGADGLETDAWALSDNEIILFHDKAFQMPGQDPINITKLTLSEVKALTLPNGQKIPTLREFFERYAPKTTISGHPLLFSIDLQDLKVGALIPPVLKEFNVVDRTVLCGTAFMALKKVRAVDPDVLLVASNLPDMISAEKLENGSKAKEIALCAFNVEANSYSPGMTEILHQFGYQSFIWDLHDDEKLKKYLGYRPDAIYSNYPDIALKHRNSLIS
jgi:glycerophosphoryl diester phosphodiesterase